MYGLEGLWSYPGAKPTGRQLSQEFQVRKTSFGVLRANAIDIEMLNSYFDILEATLKDS